jgi:hypothetical protein
MDTPLPLRHRLAIWIHLMMCRYCMRFYRQLRILKKMSGAEDMDTPTGETPESLSEETKTRIKEKLRLSL